MALKPNPDHWPDGEKNENYKADLKDAANHPERWGGDSIPRIVKTIEKPKDRAPVKAD